MHEIWEAAVEHFSRLAGSRGPEREKLPSRKAWRRQPGLFTQEAAVASVGAQSAAAAAARLAKSRLLSGRHDAFLARHPELRRSVLQEVCHALAGDLRNHNGTALLLDCERLHEMPELEQMLAAADNSSTRGNVASKAFSEMLEQLQAALEAHDPAAKELLQQLLEGLSVGFINARSQITFAAQGRVLLRSTYALVLGLTHLAFTEEERLQFLNQTKWTLENPELVTGDGGDGNRLKGDSPEVFEQFVAWVPTHRGRVPHDVHQHESLSDEVNGMSPHDNAGLEILEQFRMDRDAEAEYGGLDLWDEHGQDDHASRHEVQQMLRRLLRLPLAGEDTPEPPPEDPVPPEESPDELTEGHLELDQLDQYEVGSNSVDDDGNAILQACVEEVEAQFPPEHWGGGAAAAEAGRRRRRKR